MSLVFRGVIGFPDFVIDTFVEFFKDETVGIAVDGGIFDVVESRLFVEDIRCCWC